jgi:hypothetical protein
VNRPSDRALAIVVSVIVVAAIAIGVALVGSPTEARLRRLDQRKARDLDFIANAINIYWREHSKLPDSIEDLKLQLPYAPFAGERYEYRVLGSAKFELCARFDRPSEQAPYGTFLTHDRGRQCFPREVRKTP